jgi:hypothetical protein
MRNFLLNLRAFASLVVDEVLIHVTGEMVPDPAPNRQCVATTKPHPADGGYLCRNHLNQLGTILRDIEREARDVDPSPSIAARWNYATGGNTGGGDPAFQQAPVRLDPVVLRDHRRGLGWSEDDVDAHAAGKTRSVLGTLTTWAGRLREERRLTPPTRVETIRMGPVRVGPVCPTPCHHESCNLTARWVTVPVPPTVHSERDLLSRHLDWMAKQVWVEDAYAELRQLRDQLQYANGTSPERPMPGHCYELIDGAECGGPLWPTKPVHTVGEWTGTSPSAVKCGSCGRRWEGAGEMARLAVVTGEQQQKAATS